MSEGSSRSHAPRGRGGSRGGRGGFAGRGGRAGGRPVGDQHDDRHREASKQESDSLQAFDDEGDLSELRKLYGSQVPLVQDMFPGWSEVDVLFALKETDGDVNEAVNRIAEGAIAQWDEVSKPKKATRVKASKEADGSVESPAPAKPVRGRIVSESAGRRGKSSDRGRRQPRSRPAPAATAVVPAEEMHSISTADAWGMPPPDTSSGPSDETPAAPLATDDESSVSTISTIPGIKSWASILRQSTASKSVTKPRETFALAGPTPTTATTESTTSESEPVVESSLSSAEETSKDNAPTTSEDSVSLPVNEIFTVDAAAKSTARTTDPFLAASAENEPEPGLTPAPVAEFKLQPVSVQPAPVQPALPAQPPSITPAFPISPAQVSAPIRAPQRRVLDQQEPVRMPGHREVEHTAVQFGTFNLGDNDVDEEREEPETRVQPPHDSPPAPKTSLPPTVPQVFSAKAPAATPATTIAPTSLPSAPVVDVLTDPHATQISSALPVPAPATQQHLPQQPFSRFGQGQVSKPFDQPIPSTIDNFAAQQQPQQPQQHAPFVSPYNMYDHRGFNQHAQQPVPHGGQQQQDPYRYPYDHPYQFNNGRFGGVASGGHNTPTPGTAAQSQQPQHQHQQLDQQQQQSVPQQPGQQQQHQQLGQQHAQQQQPSPGQQQPFKQQDQFPGAQYPYYHQQFYQGFYGAYDKYNGYGAPSNTRDNTDRSVAGTANAFERLYQTPTAGNQGFGNPIQGGGVSSAADELKFGGDPKVNSVPSPALAGARPPSGANQGQAGLAPPNANAYNGFGGNYAPYGPGGFGYYNHNQGGQRGWGGNYH